MNNIHVKGQMQGIEKSLGERKIRIKPTFCASERQLDLIKRILKVREKINVLSDNDKGMIYGVNEHTIYLLRLTDIYKKNIVGILEINDATTIYDVFHQNKAYPVIPLEFDKLNQADYIIISTDFETQEKYKKMVEATGYQGKIILLYDEEDTIPFFHVPDIEPDKVQCLDGNKAFKNIISRNSYSASEYYLEMINRIDKINTILDKCGDKKILVYCVGLHTTLLFQYTNIKYKNVIAFADRDIRTYKGMQVRETSPKNFTDVDYIIISSFRFQDEIERYLIKIGLKDKIVLLYDKTDQAEFYENFNSFAPDLAYKKEEEKKFDRSDVYAMAESTMSKLTQHSNCYMTYGIVGEEFIDNGIYYRGEDEVISIKNYKEANQKIAIIIQGQIIYDKDFTYKTIKLYKMLFPEAAIILSTWKEEQKNREFIKFEDLGIEIVLNDFPEEKGILNINYQVKSSYFGLLKAKSLGYKYALKTRTDFRIHAEDSLSYIYNLTNKFLIPNNERQRLTILQPILDVSYYIPDYIMFGQINDMLIFWNADKLYPNKTDKVNPEMLLFSRYFKYIDKWVEDPVNQLEEYITVLCSDFIVADPSVFKYIWKKYSYESSMLYMERKNILTMADWFNRQLLKQ